MSELPEKGISNAAMKWTQYFITLDVASKFGTIHLIFMFFRLKITSTLCNLFRSVIALTPDDLLPCLYLCLNKVRTFSLFGCQTCFAFVKLSTCLNTPTLLFHIFQPV